MNGLPEPDKRCYTKILVILMMATLVMLSLPALAAPKTDIIVFKNGDKLTGEIKSLKRGKLSFNTDATGTISIEWDKIAHIESLQYIQIETSSGARYFGRLELTEASGTVAVATENGLEILDDDQVILMNPIEQKGIESFDIDFTFGYNFAKAGGIKQGTLGVDIRHRTLERIYSLTSLTTINDSDTQEASKRANLNLQYKRLFQNRWYYHGNYILDQNDELGLKLRTSVGGGGGRYIIQSNNMILGLQAGLQFSRENLIGETEKTNSIEAVFAVEWDWFRFDSPELDWATTLEAIPSLTESGRVRGNFNTSLKWEMITDLKLGLSFYSSYDNKPQSEEASKSDYGVNTTVTYEF